MFSKGAVDMGKYLSGIDVGLPFQKRKGQLFPIDSSAKLFGAMDDLRLDLCFRSHSALPISLLCSVGSEGPASAGPVNMRALKISSP